MTAQPDPKSMDGIEVIDTISPAKSPSEPAQLRPSELPPEEPVEMVPAPQSVAAREPPSGTNLPGVTSAVAKQLWEEKRLKIVDAEREGTYLYLTVEGDYPEDVGEADARKLAFDARFDYGFDNAGIEPYGGLLLVADTSPQRYRQTWRLTRGL